jgi:hypothetical protein
VLYGIEVQILQFGINVLGIVIDPQEQMDLR